MAVNSKADKTHGLRTSSLKLAAIKGASMTRPTSYASVPQPPIGGGAISVPGGKALISRAKQVLRPLADPNQAP